MKYTGQHLRVRNLARYQHYKNRTPPWIKLHQELLEDYDFSRLPDASKAHALCIMLLASRIDNCIPADPEWIAKKIGARSRVDLDILIAARFVEVIVETGCKQPASTTLATREQVATIEAEQSRAEAEGEQKQGAAPPTVAAAADRFAELVGEAYSRLRGQGTLPSPNDFQEALRWHETGVEFASALGVMEHVCKRQRQANPRWRPNSLVYFRDAVLAARAEVQEMLGPGRRMEVEPIDIQPRLARLAAHLPEDLPDRRRFVDLVLALKGDSAEVEDALAAIDREAFARAVAGFNGARFAEIEARVACADFGGHLDEDDLAAARDRLQRQLLRKVLRLPMLSLFSPEAEGETA